MQRKQQNTRFQRLHAKYQRLASRLQKALHSGRFRQYAHQKQIRLLRLLHRYEAQLKRLGYAAAMSAPLFLAAPTSTQAQLPAIGGEFAVNTYTTNSQQNAAIDADAQGNFIVVWESDGQDGDGFGVFGQLYDNCGNAVGSEFQVNTYTTTAQRLPKVAMDSDGDFVVVWQSNLQDGSSNGVYGQRYNSNGTVQGSEFQVNTYTTSSQSSPAVAMDNDGNFVVTWRDASAQDGNGAGVFAQRYNNAGTAQGSEFQVNTYTTNAQEAMDIAMDDDGDFVIVWRSTDQDGSGTGIFGQRFDDMGVAQGSEFQVNTYTTAAQSRPAVAMDSDGDFVVTWHSANQDGDNYGIFAQRYNSAGGTQGSEFQVNTYTTGDQNNTVVATDSDGDFVITWNSAGQDGSSTGVYAQQYDNNGNAQGSEFLVNTYTTNGQSFPVIAMESDGDFVIAWRSSGQDGSALGIYAQRYGATTGTPPSAAGGELPVNTYTTNYQNIPSVAMDSDGDFVVVWQSFGQDGSSYGIYGQRYNSSGVTQGSESPINSYTTSNQFFPSVAMDSDGDFVVVWASSGQDGSSDGIYGQRYNSGGVTQGSEFPINSYTTGIQSTPSVAMDSDGDFVVVWQSRDQDGSSYGIYGQRYNSSGMAQGSEFPINSYTTSLQVNPSVAMDSDGDFVVVWQSNGQDGADFGIYGQRYNSIGTAQGSEFPINSYTTNQQNNPSVSMDSDGDFVVVWQSSGQDGNQTGAYGQRYNSSGVAQGSEFQINSYTTDRQRFPSVAIDSDGNFVVVWQSRVQDGDDYGIYGQTYNKCGDVAGSEFQVNSYTTDRQRRPSVAMDSEGDFAVAWESGYSGGATQDGDDTGVFAQRYAHVVLPVELFHFEVRLQDQQTHLEWRTASEVNNEGFEVERLASNGWEMLGFVEGRGTSAEGSTYTFVDEQPQSGVNYYRLKQVDFDGNHEYSKIVSVEFSVVGSQLSVFPNPTQAGSFTVLLPEMTQPTAMLELYDLTGRRLFTQVLPDSSTTISTADLPKGMYQVVVQIGSEILVERLVIAN